MLKRLFRGGLILSILLLIFISCGKKISKESFSAEKYFEYAKTLFDQGKYLDAITEFTVITFKFSGNPIVDDAQFYLAESHFKTEDILLQ